MKNYLLAGQVAFSLALILLILIQSRGTGLNKSLSKSATSFTRRGLEKIIFRATFFIAGAFIVLSIVQLAL